MPVRDEPKAANKSLLTGLLFRLPGCPGILPVVSIFISIMFLPVWVLAESSTQSDEYKVKAAYLYNFSKFIKWPSEQPNKQAGATFDICILGNNNFGVHAEALAKKTTGGAQVVVISIAQYPFFEECEILFISKSEAHRLSDVLYSVANQPVLTVSDIDGFVDSGGCIEFVTRENHTDFNINARASRHSQLVFSAQLLELDKVVVGK